MTLKRWIESGPLVSCAVIAASALIGMQATARADSIEEKAAVCSGCHGENGTPIEKAIPVIWGQQEGYLYLQLRDFKKGARQNEVMSQVVSDLTRDDMLDLAAYFAAKPWPALGQATPPASEVSAAQTANSSVGCTGCHLDQYQGTGTAPRLAGQNHDYVLKTLTDFRTGARGNNPGMTSLMKATSESDIAAMASYVAGF